jgi:hypothetical protein
MAENLGLSMQDIAELAATKPIALSAEGVFLANSKISVCGEVFDAVSIHISALIVFRPNPMRLHIWADAMLNRFVTFRHHRWKQARLSSHCCKY